MSLEVQVLSPARSVIKTRARQVHAPGSLGRMGILPGHAPMVAELGPGDLKLDLETGSTETFRISGGYLDVAQDKVTVLADSVDKA